MKRRCNTTQNSKYVIPLLILILIPFLRLNIFIDSGSDIVNHRHLNNNLIRSSQESIIDEKNYAQYGYTIDRIGEYNKIVKFKFIERNFWRICKIIHIKF